MKKLTKKGVLLFAAAMAFAAFAMPSMASAATWTSTDVSCDGGPPCDFSADSTAVVLSVPAGNPVLSCRVHMDGVAFADGSTQITNARVTPGSPGCALITPQDGNGTPVTTAGGGVWNDQICNDENENYRDRVLVHFGSPFGTFTGFIDANLGVGTPALTLPTTGIAAPAFGNVSTGSASGTVDAGTTLGSPFTVAAGSSTGDITALSNDLDCPDPT
jgi:hypothetical protein